MSNDPCSCCVREDRCGSDGEGLAMGDCFDAPNDVDDAVLLLVVCIDDAVVVVCCCIVNDTDLLSLLATTGGYEIGVAVVVDSFDIRISVSSLLSVFNCCTDLSTSVDSRVLTSVETEVTP